MLQIIDNSATIRMMDGEPLEAAITKGAHHPNVVRTIDFAVTSASAADADSDSGAALERFDSATSHHKQRQGDSETWMLLEFCDCGSLQVGAHVRHRSLDHTACSSVHASRLAAKECHGKLSDPEAH